MNKVLLFALAAGALMLANVAPAEARWFEPQANWMHSGHLCASTRGPAARRWDAMAPRSCRSEHIQTPTERIAMAEGALFKKKNAPSDRGFRFAQGAISEVAL